MDAIWWQISTCWGRRPLPYPASLLAISRRMDLFGIFVLSAATAVGGGIIRDILIGNTPAGSL